MRLITISHKETNKSLKILREIIKHSQNDKIEIEILWDLQRSLMSAKILKEKGKFEEEDLRNFQKEFSEGRHPLSHTLMQALYTLVKSPLAADLLESLEKILKR